MIIDWEHHFLPEEIYRSGRGYPDERVNTDEKLHRKKPTVHLTEEIFRVDKHLEFMNQAGIDVAVLSYSAATSVEDCKLIHDSYGKIIREYPNRFVGLALCIPTLGNEAFEELKRAINEVGLKGVVISPQIEGISLDADKLWPFYRLVSSLKIPIYIHPTPLSLLVGYDAFHADYDLYQSLAREFDLANATVRIILGGVLSEFPDLKFVISHLGGGISTVLERLVKIIKKRGQRFWLTKGVKPPFSEPFDENFNCLFNKIYFDMAGAQRAMNAIKCALTTIDPRKLLFATDYPFDFNNNPQLVRKYIEDIKKLDIPPKYIELIFSGNALSLLGES